jgi:hypothetical protein
VALAHSRLGITLAFDENGFIILAPSNIRAGDILFKFNSTNALAILRPSQKAKGKCYLVGRAVAIDPKWSGLGWVELQINVRTLQMLTLVSQCPDNSHVGCINRISVGINDRILTKDLSTIMRVFPWVI